MARTCKIVYNKSDNTGKILPGVVVEGTLKTGPNDKVMFSRCDIACQDKGGSAPTAVCGTYRFTDNSNNLQKWQTCISSGGQKTPDCMDKLMYKGPLTAAKSFQFVYDGLDEVFEMNKFNSQSAVRGSVQSVTPIK